MFAAGPVECVRQPINSQHRRVLDVGQVFDWSTARLLVDLPIGQTPEVAALVHQDAWRNTNIYQGLYTPGHLKFKAIQDYLKKKFKIVLTTYVLLIAVNTVNINIFIQLRKQWPTTMKC